MMSIFLFIAKMRTLSRKDINEKLVSPQQSMEFHEKSRLHARDENFMD